MLKLFSAPFQTEIDKTFCFLLDRMFRNFSLFFWYKLLNNLYRITYISSHFVPFPIKTFPMRRNRILFWFPIRRFLALVSY